MDPLHKKVTESFPVFKLLYRHHSFLGYQPLGVELRQGNSLLVWRGVVPLLWSVKQDWILWVDVALGKCQPRLMSYL